MVYRQLFNTLEPGRVVRAAVIGAGRYATALISQAPAVDRLEITVVCDRNLTAARDALRYAGVLDPVVCESAETAEKALRSGNRIILPDSDLVMDLPIDVVVEATGDPEASAAHASRAIAHGKHVAMVSKETDVTVGPILKHLADQAGRVYSAVDGDQHGLLIGMVQWARNLGLEVLSAGKATGAEVIFDPDGRTLVHRSRTRALTQDQVDLLAPDPPAGNTERIAARRKALGLGPTGADVVEMTICANATRLEPDSEALHCPVVRIPEIPEVLCPESDGGILTRRGVIDAVICLRGAREAGLGGGVFLVVACENEYSRGILTTKGLIPNAAGSAALIYRPYHLCGVETPITVLAAGLLGVTTGAIDYRPRFDVVARANERLSAGEPVPMDNSPRIQVLTRPVRPPSPDSPLPLFLGSALTLKSEVASGEVITYDHVDRPTDSTLWTLREQQDGLFPNS